MAVRVRFAPSPTGSLHLGNALTAVANRRFADEREGLLVLRIDDTDPERVVAGGEVAILEDLAWLGVGWEEGPIRQSERAALYENAVERALGRGAIRDDDGSVRLAGTTLARADGSATYQLANVVDDLELEITHVIRGGDHRPNEEIHGRIAAALGGVYPEVVHHGLLLGEDGKKLSKRHGAASVAELRAAGIPAAAVRAYLDELGLPAHDVHYDEARLSRLAVDSIASMSDDELASAAAEPVETVPVMRGARTLLEAREWAKLVATDPDVQLGDEAAPTLARFVELRGAGGERVDREEARALMRELKAAGGDLHVLRVALTGAGSGPALADVVVALSRDAAVGRAAKAIPG